MENNMQNKADIVELKAEASALCRSVSKHIQGLDEDISRLIDIIDSMTRLQLRPEISSYLSELSKSLCWPFGDLDVMESSLKQFKERMEEYRNWFKKSPD